jgi:hypothetical protein
MRISSHDSFYVGQLISNKFLTNLRLKECGPPFLLSKFAVGEKLEGLVDNRPLFGTKIWLGLYAKDVLDVILPLTKTIAAI